MAQSTYKSSDYQHGTTGSSSSMQDDRLSSQMERMANSAQQQAEVMGENMKSVANNLDSALRRSMNEQPMTTLAMAAAVGFVLGAIWKS